MRILPVTRSAFLAIPMPAVVSRAHHKGYLDAGSLGFFMADFGRSGHGANCLVTPAVSSLEQWQAQLRGEPDLAGADPDFISQTCVLQMLMRPARFKWIRFADDPPVPDEGPLWEDNIAREPATIIAFPRSAGLRAANGSARLSE